MKKAAYSGGTTLSAKPNMFDEQITNYDKNGNIVKLMRQGLTSVNSYGVIDNLTFNLNGNQLTNVDDAATASAYNNGFEFKNGSRETVEYSYDGNGNLTKDWNKKITKIEYNYLNLPNRIEFEGGSTVSYLYDAAGTKLRAVHSIAGNTTTTDYCGNVIFENGSPKTVLTEVGYVSLNDNKYHYYLQDHQGNNRVVTDQNGTIEEVNHYYPFGGTFANSTNVQPYKYNGKELDIKNGLNWYDYGARRYDAALGRWNAVDLLSGKYYGISSYAYCANNPVKFIDKDGKDIYFYNVTHNDIRGNGAYEKGLSSITEAAIKDFISTTEGRAFFAQFAKAGDIVGGYKFTKNGALSDYSLNLWDFSYNKETSANRIAVPGSGSYEVNMNKKGKQEVTLKIVSMGIAQKEDVGETIAHEALIHGFKVADHIKGNKVTSESTDHKALLNQDMNHPGYKQYKSVQKQLEYKNKNYTRIFNDTQKLYRTNYKKK